MRGGGWDRSRRRFARSLLNRLDRKSPLGTCCGHRTRRRRFTRLLFKAFSACYLSLSACRDRQSWITIGTDEAIANYGWLGT